MASSKDQAQATILCSQTFPSVKSSFPPSVEDSASVWTEIGVLLWERKMQVYPLPLLTPQELWVCDSKAGPEHTEQ